MVCLLVWLSISSHETKWQAETIRRQARCTSSSQPWLRHLTLRNELSQTGERPMKVELKAMRLAQDRRAARAQDKELCTFFANDMLLVLNFLRQTKTETSHPRPNRKGDLGFETGQRDTARPSFYDKHRHLNPRNSSFTIYLSIVFTSTSNPSPFLSLPSI
jgi:hypothetical protein